MDGELILDGICVAGSSALWGTLTEERAIPGGSFVVETIGGLAGFGAWFATFSWVFGWTCEFDCLSFCFLFGWLCFFA